MHFFQIFVNTVHFTGFTRADILINDFLPQIFLWQCTSLDLCPWNPMWFSANVWKKRKINKWFHGIFWKINKFFFAYFFVGLVAYSYQKISARASLNQFCIILFDNESPSQHPSEIRGLCLMKMSRKML